MEKYTLTVAARVWMEGGFFGYDDIIEKRETGSPQWNLAGFAEWINDGKDFEDLQEIIDHVEEHDVKFTATVRDEKGNITYKDSMWESDAAKIALEV